MFKVFSWPTPNGHKVHVMLEECGLPYEVHPVDIGNGDQFRRPVARQQKTSLVGRMPHADMTEGVEDSLVGEIPIGERQLVAQGGEGIGHQRSFRLGRIFCDGGNPAWPSDPQNPRPQLSEQRLACLLVTPASQRGEALERIARMLARSRAPEVGINCTEIALLLLDPNNPLPLQDVARYYYARLDRADYDSNKSQETMEGTAA